MTGLNLKESDHRCAKCGDEMEEGFIADNTYGAVLTSNWVEGRPEESFWFGTKVRGKDKIQIKTYRCKGCGYLESYAR